MNYFELFGIRLQIFVDKGALKKTYFALSRQMHPDRQAIGTHTNESLLDAALLNKAWETFGNVDKTLHYILTLSNTISENEKYALDNGFLMDIMELKEQMMEAEMDEDEGKIASLKSEMEQLEKNLLQSLKVVDEELLQIGATVENLNKMKDIYYKRKYVLKNNH